MEPTDKPAYKLKHLAKSVAGKFKRQSKIWLKNIADKRRANAKSKAAAEDQSREMKNHVIQLMDNSLLDAANTTSKDKMSAEGNLVSNSNDNLSSESQTTNFPPQTAITPQQNITPVESVTLEKPVTLDLVVDTQDYFLESKEPVKKLSTTEEVKNKTLPSSADKANEKSTSNVKSGLGEKTQVLTESESDRIASSSDALSDSNTVKNINELLSSVPGLLESRNTAKKIDTPEQVNTSQKNTKSANANKPSANAELTTSQTEEKSEAKSDNNIESTGSSKPVANEENNKTTTKQTLISKILHRSGSQQSNNTTDKALSLVKSTRIKHSNSKLNLDKVSLLNLRENSTLFLTKIIEQYLETDVPYSQYTTFYSASYCHRNLAILDYILDGNTQSFFSNLYLSMESRRTYLLKVMAGLKPNNFFLASTRSEYLFDAIASGYIEKAIKLSRLTAYRISKESDDPTEFAYIALIRTLLDKNSPNSLLAMADKILAKVKKKAPHLRCVLSIKAGNQKEFHTAFKELLKLRSKEINNVEVDNEVDQLLFIEGLALLRLANINGIETDISHPMTPSHLLIEHSKENPNQRYIKISSRELSVLRTKMQNKV